MRLDDRLICDAESPSATSTAVRNADTERSRGGEEPTDVFDFGVLTQVRRSRPTAVWMDGPQSTGPRSRGCRTHRSDAALIRGEQAFEEMYDSSTT